MELGLAKQQGADVESRGSTATRLTIGVTSHRNLKASETALIRERVRAFFTALTRDFPTLPLTVLSALAEGGDQLVAEEALAVDARVIAVLPMLRAQYAEDFRDAAVRAHFDALCARAEVIELPDISGNTLDRHAGAPSGLQRDLHYAQAGIYISSHCHILLTIWDGKKTDRLGGTAQIVAYHLRGTRPPSIDRRRGNAAHAPLGNDIERLAYQIVCSRDLPDGTPAPPLAPMQTYWLAGERTTPGDAPMPEEFRAMFAHMAGFNADWAKYRTEIVAKVEQRAASGATSAPVAAMDAMDWLFQAADWLAMHFQRRVYFAMRTIYTMAALMGIAFMCYADLPAQDYMIFVFLVLFAFGVSLSVLAQRRGWHRKYLDYRALAEGLRVQSYWRRAGLSVTADSEFAHDNFLQKQDVELGWIRNVMRSAGLEGEIAKRPREPDALARVIGEWVGGSGGSGQLAYYERRVLQRTRLHRITETLGAVSLWLGIAISVFLAVFFLRLSQDTKTELVSLMAAVSIIAAVREAYAYRKADKELIKQYRFMCRIFSSARSALDRTHDPGEQREILRALGEAALAEHAEWTLMHRERPLEHARF
ncbi:MAG TPA: hypothetical protein VLK83_00995 [Rhodanobacteraceae bacterium]|nr:hypothetical protein [Rhodanobacteraceae bacterium]